MRHVLLALSSLAAASCLVLSILVYQSARETQAAQAQMTTKHQEFQIIEQAVQTKQAEFQRQQQIIEAGAAVAQKYGRAILSDVGVLAAKNNNKNLRDLLARYKLDAAFIPSPEDLKRLEEAAAQRANQAAPKTQ